MCWRSIGWEGGGIEAAKRLWNFKPTLGAEMHSKARLLYERHLSAAANAIRMASTVLLLNALPDEADRLDALHAWLLNELDRSSRNRRPVNITPPYGDAGASSPPTSKRGTEQAGKA